MADTTKVVAIFGFKRGFCVVDVYVNERKLSSSHPGVELISNPAHRNREMWWIANLEVEPETVVTLDVRVGVRGSGRDTDRTSKNRYICSPDRPAKEVKVRKVGYRDFPLLKGHFSVLIEQSDQDSTDRKIEGMLEEIE